MGISRRVGTDVTKTLDHNFDIAGVGDTLAFQSFDHTNNHTTTSRFGAAFATTNVNRFTSYNGWNRVTDGHTVSIHYPGHFLWASSHIGGGDVGMRTDEGDQLRGITTGQAFLLTQAQAFGIDQDTTFCAAIGQVDERTFP